VIAKAITVRAFGTFYKMATMTPICFQLQPAVVKIISMMAFTASQILMPARTILHVVMGDSVLTSRQKISLPLLKLTVPTPLATLVRIAPMVIALTLKGKNA
jgi:hypothetical protein